MLEFFNYLNSIHPLSPEASMALMKVIRMKELRKGQVWLQEGAVCDKLTFVVKGLMKLCFETGSKEVILYLAKENDWIVSACSFFDRQPSVYSIRSVEPTIICHLPHTELNNLLEIFPEIQIHLRLLGQRQIMHYENHAALLMLPLKDRLEKIKSTNASLFNGRLTERTIAAFLGMTPTSLSAIKSVAGR